MSWREEYAKRLADINARRTIAGSTFPGKGTENMSDEKNEVTVPAPNDGKTAETKVDVVSLGWGVLIDGELVAGGNEKLNKTEARKQAVAIAREQKPAVVTVRSAAGVKQRREWF